MSRESVKTPGTSSRRWAHGEGFWGSTLVSTVRSRPTHYEVLGLTPAASSNGIEQAFAKELLRPRPFGSLAEVTIAYETLRDGREREAYDTRFGVKAKPASPSPDAPPEWAPFLIGASAKPVVRHAINPLPRILQQADARPLRESAEAPAAEPEIPALRGRTATRASQSGQSRGSTETHCGGAATRSRGEARSGTADRRRSPSLR